MDTEIRNQDTLPTPEGTELPKRPLIGVPTGRERSQRFFGLPMYIMNQTYVRELEKRGALPVLIPLNMSEATLAGILSTLDGLFLPGGEDIDPANYGEERHPQLGPVDKERDRTELFLTRHAIAKGMPVFGVCRGVQVMNVACGGALYQDIHSQRPDLDKHDYYPPKFERFQITQDIAIEPDSRLAQALGNTHPINSMHHQGVKKLGECLRIVATAPDGLPEALECPTLPYVLGVQWHPEELAKTDQHSADLFSRFVTAAAGSWRAEVPDGWRERFWAGLANIVVLAPSTDNNIGSSSDKATVAQL
ncbi:gamma-glutamyl-gamma-aminobutyrate hydrolase family protein [bacterium]|nr:gamma-glutamyl-gamma-aminobutyrate hydrolase family protein [bacterium]